MINGCFNKVIMRYFIMSVFFLMIVTACSPKSLPTVFEQREGYAMLKVSHETTKDELAAISAKAEQQGIVMDYSNSSFFDNGRLQILRLNVVTSEGYKGQTTADIVNLQFRYYGFLYQKDGQPAFKIGEIPE